MAVAARRTAGAHADDQQAGGAEVDRGAERVDLAHGAVAVVVVAELDGREQQRYGDAGHEVIQIELRAAADSLHARPVANHLDAIVEGNRMAAVVTGGAQRKGPQVAARDAATNAGAVDV